MQRLVAVTPSTFETVILPSAKTALYEILERAGLQLKKEDKNRILFNSIATAASGSSRDGVVNLDTQRIEVDITFSSDRGDRKYNEESGEADAPALSVNWFDRDDKKVVMLNPIDHIVIRGHGTMYTISLDVRIFKKGISEALDVSTRLQTVFQDNVMLFDLEYMQLLPDSLTGWLYAIYKCGGGDPGEFREYLGKWSGDRITRIVNRHETTDATLGVNYIKKGVTMSCEISGSPEPVNGGKSPDLYQVSFTTGFSIYVDSRYSLTYPHCINNTNLPEKFLLVDKREKRGGGSYPFFGFEEYMDMLRKNKDLMREPTPYRIPWYDSWIVPSRSHPKGYVPLLIAHFTLDNPDDDNSSTVLSIEDLPFTEDVRAAIMEIANPTVFRDTFALGVYRDNVLIEPSTLTYDAPYIEIPNRFKRSMYHLVIFKIRELSMDVDEFRILNLDIIAANS